MKERSGSSSLQTLEVHACSVLCNLSPFFSAQDCETTKGRLLLPCLSGFSLGSSLLTFPNFVLCQMEMH
ncbi:unnamed protein product [Calypogeia fissa]